VTHSESEFNGIQHFPKSEIHMIL